MTESQNQNQQYNNNECPTFKEQWCGGISNCCCITIKNLKFYMGMYITAYPDTQALSNAINNKFDICNVICTITCLPVKCLILPVGCPFIFCPFWCGIETYNE